MTSLIYVIDGTGPKGWGKYWTDMERGFCARIKRLHSTRTRYLRGPTLRGLETWAIADIMAGAVKSDLQEHGRSNIVLAGHSRGGAAVIYLARKLAEDGIRIKGMLLYDAVRRATERPVGDIYSRMALSGSLFELGYHTAAATLETVMDLFGEQAVDRVPGNVDRALHFVRDESFSNFFRNTREWADLAGRHPALLAPIPDPIGSLRAVPSNAAQRFRELEAMHYALRDACRFDCMAAGVSTGFSFGNTGLKAEAPCRMERVTIRQQRALQNA